MFHVTTEILKSSFRKVINFLLTVFCSFITFTYLYYAVLIEVYCLLTEVHIPGNKLNKILLALIFCFNIEI